MKSIASVALFALITSSVAAQETGSISGLLVDSEGQQVRVGHAAVFICDSVSGKPLVAGSYRPLGDQGSQVDGLSGLAHAVTNDKGFFELKDIPSGKYRLIAQSWSGFAGVPHGEEPSEFIQLYGVCDDIEVKGGQKNEVFIRPLGKSTMTLVNDPKEPHAFLVVSTSEMRGDPVLGFHFWGEKFASNAIGVTLMETPQVTFHGLPDGKLNVGLANYDNNPGVGGTSFQTVNGSKIRIPIYASWSNGKFEPSANLLPLVEYLEKNDVAVSELLNTQFAAELGQDKRRLLPALLKHGDESITLDGFGEIRILDLAAAEAYRRLRKHHKHN